MPEKNEFVGKCLVCGAEMGKTKMRNHAVKEHGHAEKGQEALLLRVEGADDKQYWLLLDIALDATLEYLDQALRKKWKLWDHMSMFSLGDWNEIEMETRMDKFAPKEKFSYLYDMGSTTEMKITVIDKIQRPKRKTPVRIIAQNIEPEYMCSCGKKAEYLCYFCDCSGENAYYCKDCAETHDEEHDGGMWPLKNSPRIFDS